ncbi:hypothetical protein RHSIM_Rhsim02G0192000 [Rhododendron simsii]|uniref:4Fe-4S ferredoxin-type domain-containing protein n=1 Tax=Rhododendron simsii TaxID=118357 RepID=A0A834H9D9_RHOSS|nr:hypothetical protein RHSIM_Rhsim02G0192000 [Rhododendron simsii]
MNSPMERERLEGAITSSDRSAHSPVTDGEGNTTETGERNMARLHENNIAEELEGLKTVIEKQGQTINGLQTLAFQLANYYCVSQAVVFSALLGNSCSLKCHDVWFPLVLSLLPGFLNLCALHMIGNKYIEAYASRVQNILHRAALMRASLFPEDEPNRNQLIGQDPALKKRLKTYFYACIIAFAFLAIVIAFGSVWILCLEKIIVKHHDHDDDDAKCLKLCDGGKCIRICPES